MKGKISPLVFVAAAERQFAAKELYVNGIATDLHPVSEFSCNNLYSAMCATDRYIRDEEEFYKTMMAGEHYTSACWWGRLSNGEWDHESRIFALLLCAEILREKKNPKRYRRSILRKVWKELAEIERNNPGLAGRV